MALNKKLLTGTCIRSWNYDTPNCVGQALGIKNENGDYVNVINSESVICSEGTVNRVVINKSLLEKKGWVIVEE